MISTPASLESVLNTAELNERPSRPPDYGSENRALLALAQHLADSPRTILQKLAEIAMEICRAGSAGVSLISKENGDFYWPAIAGALKTQIGGGTPRNFGPCGTVLDRNSMQLFTHPERYFPYLAPLTPPIEEALLTPFYVEGEAVGTVWVIAHDAKRKFDAEDLRQIESLGRFAAAAHQVWVALDAQEQQGGAMRDMNQSLLVSSVRQHELTEQAEKAEAAAAHEITERKRAESLIQSQKQSLELLVKGEPIEQVLDFLARSMESQSQGKFLVAIHLMEADGYHFGYVAAPSLPASYALATKGMDARLDLGACSSAVMARKPTVVRDFVAETRWPAFTAQVISLGLRGCFTTPIVSPTPDQKILGTFAIYYREPRNPSPQDQQLVDLVTHTVALAIDRKQAEYALRAAEKDVRASEIRYRRLFEAARDGILILDAQTARVVEVNRCMLDLLRQPREHFLGKELWELGVFQDKQQNQEAMRQLQRDGFIRYEDLPLEDSDGRRAPVEFVSNIYQEGHHSVIQCNIRDISERARFEKERAALLANEQASRLEAEAANRAKDIFLATLSHELRTPLTAILGWAVILRSAPTDEKVVKEASLTIERNAKMQAQLIEDVLDVSRIVSGKLRLEMRSSELSRIIEDAIASVKSAADAKGIHIGVKVIPGASALICDAGRIQQVIWNLLTNAIKFSPKVGDIGVLVERANSMARITIRDSGEGISAEFLPHVFERFRQSDGTSTRKHGGLGLGLSIVWHLVELHGGTVEVKSEGLGQGATFIINLPIRAVIGDQVAGDGTAGPDGLAVPGVAEVPAIVRLDGLRVLVVDDEPDARNVIKASLEHAGAIVAAADSAATALELLADLHPHVIVSDISMPIQDGYELMKQIRSMGVGYGGRELPAIALTAYARTEDRRRALLAGFQMHVAKPVDPNELAEVVASLAGRTGLS